MPKHSQKIHRAFFYELCVALESLRTWLEVDKPTLAIFLERIKDQLGRPVPYSALSHAFEATGTQWPWRAGRRGKQGPPPLRILAVALVRLFVHVNLDPCKELREMATTGMSPEEIDELEQRYTLAPEANPEEKPAAS